jgi:hypothetical protein
MSALTEDMSGGCVEQQRAQLHVQGMLDDDSKLVCGSKVVHPGWAHGPPVCHICNLTARDTNTGKDDTSPFCLQRSCHTANRTDNPLADASAPCLCQPVPAAVSALTQLNHNPRLQLILLLECYPVDHSLTSVRLSVCGSCLYTWKPPLGSERVKLSRVPSAKMLGWAVDRSPATPSLYFTCSSTHHQHKSCW